MFDEFDSLFDTSGDVDFFEMFLALDMCNEGEEEDENESENSYGEDFFD